MPEKAKALSSPLAKRMVSIASLLDTHHSFIYHSLCYKETIKSIAKSNNLRSGNDCPSFGVLGRSSLANGCGTHHGYKYFGS